MSQQTDNILESYKGVYPSVFKRVDEADSKKTPFQVYKQFEFTTASPTSSALPLEAFYTDKIPPLGTTLSYPTQTNVDGSLRIITYFSIDHLFYKRKTEPSKTFGQTDLTRTEKYLYESASIFVLPQNKIGEQIKPGSFTLTYEFDPNTTFNYNLNFSF
jgi:hypothetical protein